MTHDCSAVPCSSSTMARLAAHQSVFNMTNGKRLVGASGSCALDFTSKRPCTIVERIHAALLRWRGCVLRQLPEQASALISLPGHEVPALRYRHTYQSHRCHTKRRPSSQPPSRRFVSGGSLACCPPK